MPLKHLRIAILASSVVPICAWAQATAASNEETLRLQDFVVSTNRDVGYRATTAVSGTRFNTSLLSTPLSVQVLTSELLRDVGVDDLESAAQYMSSVTVSNSGRDFTSDQTDFNIRGFGSGYNLRNGFRISGFHDPSNIDRVEIAKGPQTVLYGQAAPGGLVNVISKRPHFEETSGTVKVTAGSYDYFRTEADVTGPLLSTGPVRLAYRLTGAVQDNEALQDWVYQKRNVITPVIAAQIFDRVAVNLEYEHVDQERLDPSDAVPSTTPPGLANIRRAPDGSTAGIWIREFPREMNFIGPFAYRIVRQNTVTADMAVAVTEDISFRSAYLNHWSERDSQSAVGMNRNLSATTPRGVRGLRGFVNGDGFQWKHDLLFNLRGDNWNSKLLVGQESSRAWSDTYAMETPDDFLAPIPLGGTPYLDIVRSLYGVTSIPALERVATINDYRLGEFPRDYTRARENSASFNQSDSWFVTNQLSLLGERVRLLTGLRYDEIKARGVNRFTGATTNTSASDTTYQLGILGTVRPGLNLYATYATGFVPNPGLDSDGRTLPPQTGEGLDVGVKFELLEGKLGGSVTAFYVQRSKIPRNRFDLATATTYLVVSGEEEARGLELELYYNPTPAWQIALNASKVDTEIISAEPDPRNPATDPVRTIGTPVEDSEPYAASLWSRYTFRSGPLTGFSFGGGVVYRDSTKTESAWDRRYRVTDEHTLLNLFLAYDTRLFGQRTRFTVNVDNTLDEVYIDHNGSWGPERIIKAGVELRF